MHEPTSIETRFGPFAILHHTLNEQEAVSLVLGDVSKGVPLVRIHSSCLLSEALNAIDCDCKLQLDATMQLIKEDGLGVIIYLYQEGRGAGLANKIKSLAIMNRLHCDTVEAFELLGLPPESRTYSLALRALEDLKTSKRIRLVSNNPHKAEALTDAGYVINEHVALRYEINPTIQKSLKAKSEKLGHTVEWDKLTFK